MTDVTLSTISKQFYEPPGDLYGLSIQREEQKQELYVTDLGQQMCLAGSGGGTLCRSLSEVMEGV